MHTAAVFFGGAMLGGVLSAACGFDLFRGMKTGADAVPPARPPAASNADELPRLKEALASVRGEADRMKARSGDLEKAVERLTTQAGSGEDKFRLLNERVARSNADAERARGELSRLSGEVASSRRAALDLVSQVSKLRRERQTMALRFVERSRGAEDVPLVAEYLHSDASLEEKDAFLRALIPFNKDLLLSLPRESAAVRALLGGEGDSKPLPAALSPESAKQ